MVNKKEKIQQILNVFETGHPDGDYSNISIFRDGPGDIKQITYGRSQTTEFGNLKHLIKMYIEHNGEYSDEFKPYVDRIGKQPSLEDNPNFIRLLREAGNDDPVMKEVQDKFFDKYYWDKAVSWAISHGFTYPLSLLVIYDSVIHSGSIPMWLRRRFPAMPPSMGGTEEDWIRQYVMARHQWLKHHRRPILRKTIYRTKALKDAIDVDDWELDEPFNANGTIVV